jgi:TetR/AcrR family transcriptional regulator, tetracycline repressor protein
VGRPTGPLLSREAIIETALEIIDKDGLEGFGMRRLAADLNVNAASFYYYFANKNDILEAVVQAALRPVRIPHDPTGNWIEEIVRMCNSFRKTMLMHPNLVELVALRLDRNFSPSGYDAYARLMLGEGIPPKLVMPLCDAIMNLSLGSVIQTITADQAAKFEPDTLAMSPALRKVTSANRISSEVQLGLAVRALLVGWVNEIVPKYS